MLAGKMPKSKKDAKPESDDGESDDEGQLEMDGDDDSEDDSEGAEMDDDEDEEDEEGN